MNTTYCQKIEKLQKENERLRRENEIRKAVCVQETNLKNQCFSYLVHKKLYQDWDEWRKTEEAKRSIRFLLSKV